MKKFIALVLVLVLAFSAVSVVCCAADGTKDVRQTIVEELNADGNNEGETYTLMNLLRDLISRLNILLEYFATVFLPGFKAA